MNKLELSFVPYNGKVFAGKPSNDSEFKDVYRMTDVTDTFRRCVVRFCTESVIFEVDGMKFKATCERI